MPRPRPIFRLGIDTVCLWTDQFLTRGLFDVVRVRRAPYWGSLVYFEMPSLLALDGHVLLSRGQIHAALKNLMTLLNQSNPNREYPLRLFQFKVSRVDIYTEIPCPVSFRPGRYSHGLSFPRFGRGRNFCGSAYWGGQRGGNKSREICAYRKDLQLNARGRYGGQPRVRIEYRFRKAQTVRRHLGISQAWSLDNLAARLLDRGVMQGRGKTWAPYNHLIFLLTTHIASFDSVSPFIKDLLSANGSGSQASPLLTSFSFLPRVFSPSSTGERGPPSLPSTICVPAPVCRQ